MQLRSTSNRVMCVGNECCLSRIIMPVNRSDKHAESGLKPSTYYLVVLQTRSWEVY